MISCRKIPLRIEPKTYFALERTYLSWMHMAVMLGGITSALVGFSAEEESDNPQGHKHKRVTQRTTQIVAMLLLPIAMLMVRIEQRCDLAAPMTAVGHLSCRRQSFGAGTVPMPVPANAARMGQPIIRNLQCSCD